MEFGLLGINHTQSEIKLFEPIFLNKDGKKEFYLKLQHHPDIKECVILTTCNRVEFYVAATDMTLAKNAIMSLLADQKNVPLSLVTKLLTFYPTLPTVQHLFEVSCGIQSMVLGENEILGQIKDAYEKATEENMTGPLLNKCFQSAIAVGKRARTETSISRGAYSVSSIAIDAIRQHQLDYFEKSICIVGAGTMGHRCLKKLHALGHPDITLSNRTIDYAQTLASKHHVSFIPYDDILDQLHKFDIIISAVSVRKSIIFETHLLANRPYLLLDLGLPRNIDPALESNSSIKLINVDGLKEIASKNIHKRQHELKLVNAIIDEDINQFNQWLSNRKKYTQQNS